ncbi:MAG: hypothetical protein E7661_05750 [Ruminococcaceae bacterium]|nr:hypothetical protein [Oscillospiraceae bacterium]
MKKFLALLLSAMMILSCFTGMTFTVAAEENAESTTSGNLVIPQEQWTISGHCTEIVHKTGHGNSGMVAAGGVESGALLHQGSIGLGNIDLSKYSKVIIYWGSDASQVTVDAYAANANNRFALVSADKNMKMSPDEDTIIAAATYELHGWSVEPFEIDLTDVDYNGPVFLTHDSLPGGFALVSSIEFVPAPATDYDVPMDTWTVSGHAAGLTSKDKEGHGPMVAAGGLDVGALLHQGAVGVGEIDLSKYEKVVISYGIDNSPVTVGHYEANANNRVMLSKTDNNMTNAPAEEDIIASATYTLEGWSLVTIEIDLTEVDYNGPVYVTYDTLPGTFMLIGKIEFLVPAAEDEGPVYEERSIALGKGGQGTPFSGSPDYYFGQRYDIGTDVLSNISILNMATYSDGGVNKWTFKVWQWDTDYATTVAGTPLFEQAGENHNDNATFSMNIPTELDIRGDIYYEITYVEGPDPSKTFTGWTANDGPAEGVETYVAGVLKEGTYRATMKVIGLPLPPDPNEDSLECLFTYDFSKYSENATADFGITNANPEVKVNELCKNGYITLDSTGGDPNFTFAKSPSVPSSQADYVVIKYRTSVAGASGEFYTARTDGVNWAAPMEKSHITFNYEADGQWHTVLVDASEVWGNVNHVELTNFRFDYLVSAGTIDVSYIKFFATREGAEAHIASETKEVSLSGEYLEGADGVIIVGGGAYSADKWVKLSSAVAAGATQTFAGDAGKFSICADEVRSTTGGELTKYCTQEAHLYMASVNGKIVDAEGAFNSISFRGWANPTVGGLEIAEFGYAINDQAPVFNADFAIDEPSLNEALGSAAARRFENIEIPTAELADGVYNIYVLVKDTEGTVYCMNGNFGGGIQYVKGNVAVAEYPYVDAEGNGYTVRADGVLFDADGFDTGMHLFTADDGTPYGAAHYFALEYQDPAAGAVEIDGTKYTYTTKVALTPKMEPVDPENEIVTATYDAITTHVSTDTIYIGSDIVASGPEVPAYITAAGSVLRDTNKAIDTMIFRGWVGHNESPVAQFGYAFDNGEPVWGEYKEATEDPVKAAGGGENSQRFAIKVDISGLSEAKHSLYLLVKYEDGTIVTMNNIWTNLIIVKGGSWKQVGYTDGTNTYEKAEDGSVTINGEAATGKLLATDDGANYYDGIAALDENAKGKYLYNVTLTYTVDPEIPVNPAELKPVYLIDGEMLNVSGGQGIADATYDYENGCITYTATAPDPNTHGQNFVPAGTILGRYMVLKYRTSSEGAQGECFVGTSAGASGPDNVRYPAYITDGEWHTLIADLSVSKEWSADGLTNHFRNDILIEKGHSIDIEYYAFFNTLKEATYYAENDMHELPKLPQYYTITFMADGEVVREVTILEGTTTVKAPKVPAKEGYEGAWEEYTITGDRDQIINAIYTEIAVDTEPPVEPDTDPVEPDTDPVEPGTDPVEPGTDPVEPDTEAETKEPEEEIKIDPAKLSSFPKDIYNGFFTSPNQTEIIFNDDGSVTFKGTWDETTNPLDPFVTFNYGNLMRRYVDKKLQNVPNKNGEYSSLVLKVKIDESIAGNFLLHYAVGRGNNTIDGSNVAYPDIDAQVGADGYQYIIFDLEGYPFAEDVISVLRLDWVDNGVTANADNIGASMTLYEIALYENYDAAIAACGIEEETEPEDDDKPADTDSATEAATQAPATPVESDTAAPEEGGCGSVIASASVVVVAAAAFVALKKKKEND